jgi:ketosteroid isomerase-like protein
MPTAREIKDKLHDAVNEHDIEQIIECFAPDAVYVTPAGVVEGREQIAWYYEHLFAGFPDLRIVSWHKVVCDEPAVTEFTMAGTHSGPFLLPDGRVLEGTGRHITVRAAGAAFIEDGKIITDRDYYDQLELYSQLGLSLSGEPVPG